MSVNRSASIKIVLCGPSNAGKTSIAKRFTTDRFDEFQDMTVGSAFFSKQMRSEQHQTVARVELWDTAGQEKYRAMAPMYFRHAAGALLVFDETSPTSFDELLSVWLPELLPHMKNSTQFIMVCGNKCDIASDSAFIQRVEEQCSVKGLKLFATSAKTGQNVQEVFQHLVDEILTGREKEAQQQAAATASAGPGAKSAEGQGGQKANLGSAGGAGGRQVNQPKEGGGCC